MTPDANGKQVWRMSAPSDGVQTPWPQIIEIVQAIPHSQWTLVGGLMVQLHCAYAGMQVTRTTRDVDMILHIETGAATFSGVQHELERLGYVLREPIGKGPIHRFSRGDRQAETIDVMVADHLSPKRHPKVLGRNVFAVPGGTSALNKTINCEVNTAVASSCSASLMSSARWYSRVRPLWRTLATENATLTMRRYWLAP